MDVLQDLMRAMRLTGGIFLDAEFTAPWCVTAQVGPEDCLPFTAVPRHVIAYHYVIDGTLRLKVKGQAPVEVGCGEIVLLPRNDHHVIGSTLDRLPTPAENLIQSGPAGGLAQIRHGGGGARTHLLCGFLGSDMQQNTLTAMLPSVLRHQVADGEAGNWIESSFRFAARELSESRLHSPAILARLAELLFIEAVQRYITLQPTCQTIWEAAIHDAQVGRALELIHGQMGQRWTTETLARMIGLSRSAFAERFTRIIGEPPMHYLTRRRLEQASVQMQETSDPIARIAYAAGYESEAAFSRAFRRAYGLPPARWRRQHRDTASVPGPEI